MLDFYFHYDFEIAGKKLRGGVFKKEVQSVTDHPPSFPGSCITCSLQSVYHIFMTDKDLCLKVFLDEEVFGANGNHALLLDAPRDIALIEGCPGHWFLAQTEPTMEGMLGMTVITPDHKTRFIGEGNVIEADNGGSVLSLTFKTVYPFKTTNPFGGTAHGGANHRDPNVPGGGGQPDGGVPPVSDGGVKPNVIRF